MTIFRDEHLHWIGGPQAKSPILKLVEAFHRKKSAEFQSIPYSPWMTFTEAQDRMSPLIKNPVAKGLVLDSDELQRLKAALSDDQGYLSVLRSGDVKTWIDPNVRSSKPWLLEEFQSSLGLLATVSPWAKTLLDHVVLHMIPVQYAGLAETARGAFSQHLTKGVIYLCLPKPSTEDARLRHGQNAIDIAHELGHNVLMVYLASDKVLTSDPYILVYSGARRVKRPSYASLHSAVALAYMLSTADRLSKCREFPTEIMSAFTDKAILYQEALRLNVASLEENCSFTPFGKILMRDFWSLLENVNGTQFAAQRM